MFSKLSTKRKRGYVIKEGIANPRRQFSVKHFAFTEYVNRESLQVLLEYGHDYLETEYETESTFKGDYDHLMQLQECIGSNGMMGVTYTRDGSAGKYTPIKSLSLGQLPVPLRNAMTCTDYVHIGIAKFDAKVLYHFCHKATDKEFPNLSAYIDNTDEFVKGVKHLAQNYYQSEETAMDAIDNIVSLSITIDQWMSDLGFLEYDRDNQDYATGLVEEIEACVDILTST